VTLAEGARRMAREGVIVKHLPAIQNFGSIDVLCSDKTGTLTAGVMQFDRACDPAGAAADRPLTLAFINSSFQAGIRSPFDVAILARDHVDVAGYQKVDEIPFDFERRRLSVVVTSPDGPVGGTDTRLLVTKGAPEAVLAVTTSVEIQGRVEPLTPDARRGCAAVYEQLGADGFCVLAVASRRIAARDKYTTADESELVLAGLVSFADPVLPDAAATLAELRGDGVAVKILTGDGDAVARHVCAQIDVGRGDCYRRRDRPRGRRRAWTSRRTGLGVHARVSRAEEPHHPGPAAARPRRRLSR
jgi:Mg2+-importing ATPase